MKGMRDGKGPITSSALNKMMKKFEVTGSLASSPKSGLDATSQQPLSNRCCCHDNGRDYAIHTDSFCTCAEEVYTGPY